MRPKKLILLYCADRQLLAATAFALRLHPYDVVCVDDGKDATVLPAGKETIFFCCMLIHAQQGDPAGRVVRLLLENEPHVPLLLIDRVGDLAPVRYADIVLYGRNTSMEHILAALQVLCRRKSGPKPRSAA